MTVPDAILKIRKSGVPGAVLRSTARLPAPGPVTIRFVLMASSPLVSMMFPVTAKSIVSPAAALAIACRNEPGPLSATLVTVRVAASPRCVSKTATKNSEKTIRFLIISVRKRPRVGKEISNFLTNGTNN